MADILSLQEDLAAKIFENLRLRLSEDTKKKLTKPHTANVEAYQLYLKGRYVLNQYTEDGWTKAVEYFRQALEIEPGFALAWAGLADAYYELSSLVLLPGEAIPKARAAAMRALEIDDSLAEAHAALGKIKSQYDWDRSGAETEFRRAIQLNPSHAAARQWLGIQLFTNARFDDALTAFRRARELDPLSVEISVTETWALLGLGRYEDALQELRRDMELHPEVSMFRSYSHDVRGRSYLERGMVDEAFGELVIGWDTNFLTGGGAEVTAALTDAYKVSGMTGYWQKELQLASVYYRKQVEQARAQSVVRYVTPFRLAGLYMRVGDTDRAFALLDEAYKNRDENILFVKAESMTAGSPWRNVATDPRLLDLIRRLGLGGS
jgi:tetratricopeptide (TPR) repeat protein